MNFEWRLLFKAKTQSFETSHDGSLWAGSLCSAHQIESAFLFDSLLWLLYLLSVQISLKLTGKTVPREFGMKMREKGTKSQHFQKSAKKKVVLCKLMQKVWKFRIACLNKIQEFHLGEVDLPRAFIKPLFSHTHTVSCLTLTPAPTLTGSAVSSPQP